MADPCYLFLSFLFRRYRKRGRNLDIEEGSLDNVFGFPVATAENVFDLLRSHGIKPWTKLRDPMSTTEFAKTAEPDELAEMERFGPKAEVVFLRQPNGKDFRGYRSLGKTWVTTFVMFPFEGRQYVVIIGEWKHGTEGYSLAPPSGVLSKADEGSFPNCALRETVEETGLGLAGIMSLSNDQPIGLSTRQSVQTYYPFDGVVIEPIVRGPSKLDSSEHLLAFVMPLEEWLKLIETGGVQEECSIGTTYLALRRRGMLTLNIPQPPRAPREGRPWDPLCLDRPTP